MKLSTYGLVLASDAAIDLQTHTIYSDGKWTPEALIDHFISEGFGLAAITDHDRSDTAALIQQVALEKHFHLLVAVEMTARWKGQITDILCYSFDPEKPALGELAEGVLRRQQENTKAAFDYLDQNGYVIPNQLHEMTAILEKPSAQQPHALVELLKKHNIGSPEKSAGKILHEAGVDFATNDVAAVVDAVHRSGAVALIAHPGRDDGFVCYNTDLLDELRRDVPIDGLEVYYPLHTSEQTAMFQDYALKHHLLTSSGSDSHGPDKLPIKYKAELSRNLLKHLGIQIR